MATLVLVPHQELARKWRLEALCSNQDVLPFSLKGLVSQLLKEKGQPYRDNLLLEQVALRETVWELETQLQYYAHMVKFAGFIEELHSLFLRLGAHQTDLQALSSQEQQELTLIYEVYQQKLADLLVWDQPKQIAEAIDFWPHSKLNAQVDHVQLYYLGQLTPLEQQLVDTVCQGRRVERCEFNCCAEQITGLIAAKPEEELEYTAEQIAKLLAAGIDPEQIAVVSPALEQYLPLLIPIFNKWQLPWQQPPVTLADTPIGKVVLSVARLLSPPVFKEDLEQLVAVGWGLPSALTPTERKALKLAPPTFTKMSQWCDLLHGYPGWQTVLQFLTDLSVPAGNNPVNLYISRLQQIFIQFPLTKWPVEDHQQWAVLMQAYDAVQQIFSSLSACRWLISHDQFCQMLRSAIASCTLPQPHTFHQTIMVGSLSQAIGMNYHSLFLIGMTEESFPRPAQRDWLSKQILPSTDHQVYKQLLRSSKNIYLSFAETDASGRPNLASTVFPEQHTRLSSRRLPQAKHTFVIENQVAFVDPALTADIINRYQQQQLSVSRLNLYASCPFRFLCSELYQLQTEEIMSEDITAQEEGTLIHAALKQYWEKKGTVPIEQILDERFTESGQKLTPRVIKMVANFNAKDVQLVTSSGYYPKYLEHIFAELPIRTSQGIVKLRGVIDRIDLDADGNYVIYDYKSGGNPSVREILDRKNLQLQVYALAARTFLPGTVHGLAFYNIKNAQRTGLWRESVHKRLGLTKRNSGIIADEQWDELIEEFYSVIQSYLEQIFSGYFPVAPSDERVCTYCSYLAICRKE